MEELELLETEGRGAAAEVRNQIRARGECLTCERSVVVHCDGCATCPGQVHPWWCRGDICVCGCHKDRHEKKAYPWDGKPFTLALACPCGCQIFRDLEHERDYQRWCDCSDEEKASRRALAGAILQEFALGLGAFDGLDTP
jgi:hypothetical protein